MKNLIYLMSGLLLMALNTACDKVCNSTVEKSANVQNMTGRALSLQVCQSKEEVTLNVTADTYAQNILVKREAGQAVAGGTDACSKVENQAYQIHISLAPVSFSQVKFCYDQPHDLTVIVEKFQMCPTGFLEQTTTGNCAI